jgi:glycosyltransferase involved in cell wall biosynthesis
MKSGSVLQSQSSSPHLRILHVIGWLDFADGGPPMLATRLAAAQARLGYEVSIALYSSGGDVDQQTDKRLAGLPFWDKVAVHRFPPSSRLERLTGRAAGRRLRPLIESADVIHLHNVWEGILLQGAAIARSLAKPYILVVNGMLDPWALAQKGLKKRLALTLTHRRMLNGAMLHLLNEDERRLIVPLGITAQSTIIPNGVTLEEIDPLPPRGEFLSGRRELGGRHYVLFLARLHYKKGLDYLADSFAILAKKHPALDLVVAGPDGGERESFQARVAAAGLTGRVHVVGPLYNRQKMAALVDCECFVLPSRQEGFSIAVLEAMAAGAPVVLSEACHFQEAATAGAGEVVPLDAAALAAAMDRVVSDPDRARFGKAGRALVEAHYTWQKVAEQTVAVYQKCLAARGSR